MDTLIRDSQVLTLIASALRTASITGSGVNTLQPYLPGSGVVQRRAQAAYITLLGTLTSGTVDAVIEGSDDGVNWFPVPLSSAFTQVTTTGSTQKQVRRVELSVIPRLLRAVLTAATSPSFTLKVEAVVIY